MPALFQKLDSLSSGSLAHRFFFQNPEAFDELSRITAVDKAGSVPYVKVWRVKPDGSPVHPDQNDPGRPASDRTISVILIEPPTFGSSVERYPERPPVSLERISVKNNFQLGGPILYRELQLEFVVHRPELVFDESNDDYSQWSALILPGAMFALKYGWTGTCQNGIMNGDGVSGGQSASAVEGQKTVLFVVTRYGFSIAADGSINFTVYAHENCDNILNRVSMADLDIFDSPAPPEGPKDLASLLGAAVIKEFNTQTGTTIIKKLQNSFDGLEWQGIKKHGRSTRLQEVLDKVFAPLMDKALRSVGYGDVKLFVGNFNNKLGPTKEEHGGNLAGKSVGDFKIPERWLKVTLGKMREMGAQMNLYNFFQQLVSYVVSSENWLQGLTEDEKRQTERSSKENKRQQVIEEMKILGDRQSPPELKIKTTSVTEGRKYVAYLYLVDMKQAHVSVDTSDRLNPKTTTDDIVQKLQKYGIPRITFKHGLSYIESAQFQAEQDPQVQAVFISRAVDPSRYQVANVTHAARVAEGIDPRKNIYSSAITGKVSMLGNFVFDSFQMVWLEFGVRRWDGTFFVFEKEDVIDRSSFTSHVSFRSTGDDPLNTQGVLQANQSQTPT